MTDGSLFTFIDALKSLWWAGWVMGLCFGGMFSVLLRLATKDQKAYFLREQHHAIAHEKWNELYKESQRLSLDLLKSHEPEQYEIALKGLSELYANDLIKRHSKT